MSSNQPQPSIETAPVPQILDSPEEVLSTLQKDGKRRWLYPTPVQGLWTQRRRWLGWFLIALFVAAPIVPVGGKPAIFLDIVHREFTILGQTLYATDTLLLMLFMLGLLLAVFLGTALLGRLWCGWGCPQTVYMEFVFRPIERWIEGKEST
ncbi:MAG: 4Fe-4S binding protein, partial [Myxococcota bacterium]